MSPCKYIKSFLSYFKVIRYLILTSVIAGLVGGFVSSSLSHLLPRPAINENNDTNIAIALIFFGLGNVLGGYASGIACDRFCLRKAGYIGCFLVIIASTL